MRADTHALAPSLFPLLRALLDPRCSIHDILTDPEFPLQTTLAAAPALAAALHLLAHLEQLRTRLFSLPKSLTALESACESKDPIEARRAATTICRVAMSAIRAPAPRSPTAQGHLNPAPAAAAEQPSPAPVAAAPRAQAPEPPTPLSRPTPTRETPGLGEVAARAPSAQTQPAAASGQTTAHAPARRCAQAPQPPTRSSPTALTQRRGRAAPLLSPLPLESQALNFETSASPRSRALALVASAGAAGP